MGRRLLGDPVRPGVPVGVDAADEDEGAAPPGVDHRLHRRQVDVVPGEGAGGVDDGVGLRDGVPQPGQVGEVAFDDVDALGGDQMGGLGPGQRQHGAALRGEFTHDERAHAARRAGDQHRARTDVPGAGCRPARGLRGALLRRPFVEERGQRPGRAGLEHVEARERQSEVRAQPFGELHGFQGVAAEGEEVVVRRRGDTEHSGEGVLDRLGPGAGRGVRRGRPGQPGVVERPGGRARQRVEQRDRGGHVLGRERPAQQAQQFVTGQGRCCRAGRHRPRAAPARAGPPWRRRRSGGRVGPARPGDGRPPGRRCPGGRRRPATGSRRSGRGGAACSGRVPGRPRRRGAGPRSPVRPPRRRCRPARSGRTGRAPGAGRRRPAPGRRTR